MWKSTRSWREAPSKEQEAPRKRKSRSENTTNSRLGSPNSPRKMAPNEEGVKALFSLLSVSDVVVVVFGGVGFGVFGGVGFGGVFFGVDFGAVFGVLVGNVRAVFCVVVFVVVFGVAGVVFGVV